MSEDKTRWSIQRDGEDLLIRLESGQLQRYVPEAKFTAAKRWTVIWKRFARELRDAWLGQSRDRNDLRLQLENKEDECQFLKSKLKLVEYQLHQSNQLIEDESVQRLLDLHRKEKHTPEWLVTKVLSLPSTQAKTEWLKQQGVVVMRQDVKEDGSKYWYVQHPEFLCDIEEEENGSWSIFFRSEKGKEGYAESVPHTEIQPLSELSPAEADEWAKQWRDGEKTPLSYDFNGAPILAFRITEERFRHMLNRFQKHVEEQCVKRKDAQARSR